MAVVVGAQNANRFANRVNGRSICVVLARTLCYWSLTFCAFTNPAHIVHVAIRQRFNRVCAFAWKSLKLNASDGNLYASPMPAPTGPTHRRLFSLERAWLEGKVVPKLICVGFGTGKLFTQGFNLSLAPCCCLAHCHWQTSGFRLQASSFMLQCRLVINVANANL